MEVAALWNDALCKYVMIAVWEIRSNLYAVLRIPSVLELSLYYAFPATAVKRIQFSLVNGRSRVCAVDDMYNEINQGIVVP